MPEECRCAICRYACNLNSGDDPSPAGLRSLPTAQYVFTILFHAFGGDGAQPYQVLRALQYIGYVMSGVVLSQVSTHLECTPTASPEHRPS